MNSIIKSIMLLIISATLAISLMACGSGGGGSGSGGSNSNSGEFVISNLSYNLENGQTYDDALVNVTFDFNTTNDISTVTYTFFDSKMNKMGSFDTTTQGASGIKTGYINGGFYLLPGFFDILTFEIRATDTYGIQSNTISATCEVYGGFGRPSKYPYNRNYYYGGETVIGDLNGDSKNDVAVIQGSNNTGLVQIFYQNSEGKLNSPIEIITDIYTRGIAIEDIDNDGHDDLIISGISKFSLIGELGRLVVYKHNTDSAQLMAPIEYTVSSSNVGPLEIADLNSDGLNDIAVISQEIGNPGNLSFFFQDINGDIHPEVLYKNVFVRFTGEIHVADMDNDGDNDVVLQSGLKEIALIKQISPGQFSNVPDLYQIVTNYWSSFNAFALGDVNGDGLNDVVVAEPSGYLNFFLQNNEGMLNQPVVTAFSPHPDGIEIFDITGDGLNDVIGDYSGIVLVYPQADDHTFSNISSYSLLTQSYGGSSVHEALSIGDVTGDGYPDAIATWSDEGLFVLPFYPQLSMR